MIVSGRIVHEDWEGLGYAAMQTVKALELLIFCALFSAAALYTLNQVRKPTKWVGRFFLGIMNASLATKGMIWGVDYAQGSVAASRRKSAQLIRTGRVEIKQASVFQVASLGHFPMSIPETSRHCSNACDC